MAVLVLGAGCGLAASGPQDEAELTTCVAGVIEQQADIDVLEGCQVVRDSLDIRLPYADLRPLHALQVVEANLAIRGISSETGEPDYAASVASLEGLESLVSVGNFLSIDSTAAPSLGPLRNLRNVGNVNAAGLVEGALLIYDNANLRDLMGLEALDLEKVVLDVTGNEQLASLQPLVFPPRMFGRLLVRRNPLLSDLAGIETLEAVEYLHLGQTLLENLDALSGVRRASVVWIDDNPMLVDASGLAQLEAAEFLSVTHQPRLAQLPDFEQMTEAGSITISGNDILRSTPLFPRLEALAGGWAGQLDIRDNPALEEVRGPRYLQVADRLGIERNPNLISVDLPRLRELRESLVVLSNPRLDEPSEAALLSVAAPFAKVAGNDPAWSPLDPCPWVNDRSCDEARGTDLCASGSDAEDCSPPY